MDISKLESEVLRHNQLYLEGNPEISDYEYDQLIEHLKVLHPHSNILIRVGANIPSYGRTVKHVIPMGSIDKCNKMSEYQKWFQHKHVVVWSWKVDGVALSITYKKHKLFKACTRGDGYIGMDITDHIRNCPDIPQTIDKELTGDIEVRGDAYIPKRYWKE